MKILSLPLFAAGGPVIWILTALSVATFTVIFWKLVRFLALGAWEGDRGHGTSSAWKAGRVEEARSYSASSHGPVAKVQRTAILACLDSGRHPDHAREETERAANRILREFRSGLRLLESAAVLAPLLGLLGTVLGMIDAFRALEAAEGAASPAVLAGGIWEALLTTAFGMTIAIVAAASLSVFESAIERTRHRIEEAAAEILLNPHAERTTDAP